MDRGVAAAIAGWLSSVAGALSPRSPGRGRWTSRQAAPSLQFVSRGGFMTRRSKFRSLAVALGAVSIAVAACGGGNQGTSETLAADQTLSFPMVDDIGDLDPAHMSAAVDIDIFRNVYSGLYRFDDQLNEVPDIATGAPKVSDDQKTYTFTMRKDVKFSNGDPVKADDFIFSWNRAAAIQGDYASVFQPVVGYDDVANV